VKAAGAHVGYAAMSTPAGREQQFEAALQLGMGMIGTANNPLQGIAAITNPANHTVSNWSQAAERDNEIGEHAKQFGADRRGMLSRQRRQWVT
jgi:hypothetical protein